MLTEGSPGSSPTPAYGCESVLHRERESWAHEIEKAGQGNQRLTLKHDSFVKFK